MRSIYLACFLILTACSSTVPVSYQPQSYMKIGSGEVEIGTFGYQAAQNGIAKPNEIKNTALGNIYMSTKVSDFVQRATALELERAGIQARGGAAYRVEGNVLNFTADDLGYSVDWEYSIRYKLLNSKTQQNLIDKIYYSDVVRTGKFGNPSDYTALLNEMILKALEKFMRDIKQSDVFS
jgi:hypothetical protein